MNDFLLHTSSAPYFCAVRFNILRNGWHSCFRDLSWHHSNVHVPTPCCHDLGVLGDNAGEDAASPLSVLRGVEVVLLGGVEVKYEVRPWRSEATGPVIVFHKPRLVGQPS